MQQRLLVFFLFLYLQEQVLIKKKRITYYKDDDTDNAENSVDGRSRISTNKNKVIEIRTIMAEEEVQTEAVATPPEICSIEQLKLAGKKGVCMCLREDGKPGSAKENLPRLLKLKPSWHYCWGNSREACGKENEPTDIDFLPMTWGCYGGFPDAVKRCADQNPKMILSFNEPDQKDQSNMRVEKAVRNWPKYHEVNIPIVSPSCAHPHGKWMEEFMEQVEEKGLRVDVIGYHEYGGAHADGFKKRLRNMYEKYNRPILITEFAVADWQAKRNGRNKFKKHQVLKFMKEVLPWLEETEWIIGYCWFSFQPTAEAGCCSSLFDENGELTELGEYYANFKPNPKLIPEGGEEPKPKPSPAKLCSIEELTLSGGKKGIGLTLRERGKKGSAKQNLPKIKALNPSWYYGYGPSLEYCNTDDVPSDIEFIPMTYGCNTTESDDHFSKAITKCVNENPKMILSFHRPEKKDQANVSVEKAIANWHKYERTGLPIVSPSCQQTVNSDWLKEFMEQVDEKGLRVDVISYSDYCGINVENFKERITRVYERYNRRPILITEMVVGELQAKKDGVVSTKFTMDQVINFLQKLLPWLDETEWIIGYSWYSFNGSSTSKLGGTYSTLFDDDGQLTELGKFYAEY